MAMVETPLRPQPTPKEVLKMNHAQEAVEYLDLAANEEDPAWAQVRLTRAQVHATLELAEQQRIANLVAFLDHSDDGRHERRWRAANEALERRMDTAQPS